MKYRRKDETYEAVQWMMPGDHPEVKNAPYSFVLPEGTETFKDGKQCGYLRDELVTSGDWIITRHNGRSSHVSASDFAENYEPAE